MSWTSVSTQSRSSDAFPPYQIVPPSWFEHSAAPVTSSRNDPFGITHDTSLTGPNDTGRYQTFDDNGLCSHRGVSAGFTSGGSSVHLSKSPMYVLIEMPSTRAELERTPCSAGGAAAAVETVTSARIV